MKCTETDATIVLRKDDTTWSERSCGHPEHWTPNCQVVGVVYDGEPNQEKEVEKLLSLFSE